MQTSRSAGAGDKTKRRIRIVVSDNNIASSSSPSAPAPTSTSTTSATMHHSHSHSPSRETKHLNIEYSDGGGGLVWDKDKDVLILSGRNKNDKNWENWERIREQKLEKMKNICFESYRQSKRDKLLLAKPRPKQLDSTWYTDNIYSNRSDDLDEDYVPDCLKYGSYSNRILRDIREQDEKYAEDALPMRERRGEGEGSPGYGLQRSKSCKEFQYPKSQSCCFEGNVFETAGTGATTTTSILKNRAGVPKSYSFSASTKTMPFDIIDYELPPASNTRREKREAYRRSMNMLYSNSLDERTLAHSCCAREQCTSAKCLLDDIYAGSRRRLDVYGAGAGASAGSNRNLNRNLRSPADWLFEERAEADHRSAMGMGMGMGIGRGQRLGPAPAPAPTVICCCATDDYCCHRQPQHRASRPTRPTRPHCPGHHPAAEEEEHMHCRYDTDLEHFIRAERDRLLLQDKFLDEDERYLAQSQSIPSPGRRFAHYNQRPTRSKSLLEVQPPSLFDDDSCSDTTEIDLEDFNIDLEKYWEQLDKPPSPINMDMRRNMHSNLKVKNVNVRCYNNGQPIDMHDREHERLMIKKSLLEGMPSPPQLDLDPNGSCNNAAGYPFFENTAGPLHHQHQHQHHQQHHQHLQHHQRHLGVAAPPAPPAYGHGYGHKVYPTADTLPSYQYNNFYPEHTTLGSVLTQQPTAGIHHASAGGHSALSLINNIFSIYKPNKYSPENCQLNYESKPEPCKKMNVPSTRRPLGAVSSNTSHGHGHCHEYLHSSMKRPLLVSADQPHFKIIPEKTGLKISPLLAYDEYGGGDKSHHRLSSTARPLMLPH